LALVKRNTQLDALRALAVLLVLGFHVGLPVVSRMGWSGVDLFFVISGFLISGLLFREYNTSGKIRIGRFLGRRGLKIYPAYYLLLSGTVLGFSLAGDPLPWSRIWPNLLFVQNYKMGTWEHLWSLAVEEQFYIILPIGLSLMLRKKGANPFARLPLLWGLVAAACLTLRCLPLVTGWHYEFLSPSSWRGDSLAFGVLIAYFWEFHPGIITQFVSKTGQSLLAASLLLITPSLFFPAHHPFMQTIGFTCIYLGYGGLLIYCLKRLNGNNIVVRSLAYIGVYSYTIYLIHWPVGFWVVKHGYSATGFHPILVCITYLCLSIAVGILFGMLVELPVLKIRDRLFPRPCAGFAQSTEWLTQFTQEQPALQLAPLNSTRAPSDKGSSPATPSAHPMGTVPPEPNPRSYGKSRPVPPYVSLPF
jgi:peptidoglycan/LPS O-acetylase OafA/YrhL